MSDCQEKIEFCISKRFIFFSHSSFLLDEISKYFFLKSWLIFAIGVLARAEIIPLEPDPGNAGVGKKVTFLNPMPTTLQKTEVSFCF